MNPIPAIGTAAALLLAVAGCSDDPLITETFPADIAGTVLVITNDLPVDGEAALSIRDEADGRIKRAYLPSLFTNPPPDDRTIADFDRVMAVFANVRLGDRVLVRGAPEVGGLRMQELAIR